MEKLNVQSGSAAFASILVATNLVAATLALPAFAGDAKDPELLLSVNFEPRQVAKLESGDFRFRSGQLAPIHTHVAPAIGYATKGAIVIQVEGSEAYYVSEGDVFYEPAGPRMLRFVNASSGAPAKVIVFSLHKS